MSLEFEEETYLLRRCFFEVQNEVGHGRHEDAYHRACAIWLAEHGVPFASRAPHRVLLQNEEAHRLFPDFVVWNAISIELKAVPRHLNRAEFVQLFDYLKCRRDRLGLLVNMGLDRVEVERVLYDPPETEWIENWTSWTDLIDGAARETGHAVREALRSVYAEHSTGYGDEVLTKLVLCALRQAGLSVTINPIAKAFFRGVTVGESALAAMIVNEQVLLTLSALFDTNDFNVNRGRSYLRALGLQWGVAASFGKKRAEFIGIRRGS